MMISQLALSKAMLRALNKDFTVSFFVVLCTLIYLLLFFFLVSIRFKTFKRTVQLTADGKLVARFG